jgi:hypothetical protein
MDFRVVKVAHQLDKTSKTLAEYFELSESSLMLILPFGDWASH